MRLNNIKFYYKGLDNPSLTIQNSASIMINLNTAKLFNYTVSDGSYSIGPKEFDLTFVCKSKITADDVLDKLMYDRTYGTENGTLNVDGFNLDCVCTGVTNIETDKYDVVKFSAHFYAKKGFRWYEAVDATVTVSDAGLGFYSLPGWAGERTFRIRANVSTSTDGAIILGTATTTLGSGGSRYSAPTQSYLILDGHNKIYKTSPASFNIVANSKDMLPNITEANNMFLAYSSTGSGGGTSFGIRVTGATAGSTMYIREYRYRGMPKWKTT